MNQKVRQLVPGGALSLVAFFGFMAGLSAQTTNVSFLPPPDWLRMVEWSAPNQQGRDEKSEGTRYLLYERHENPGQKEIFTRIILLMENETGVQDSGSLTFEFDPSFQELILHEVLIHRGGKVLERLDKSKIKIIQPEAGLDRHLFTGEQSALLFVEDLRVGDALEYAYTIRGDNPILAGHYSSRFVVQSSVPVDRQRFRVVWASANTLHLRQHLTGVAPKKGPWKAETEYVWDFADLAAIPYEDSLPASYEPYPYVEASDFENWARVVEWALPLYTVEKTNMPSELRELINQWRSAPSEEERARLALQFVQDDLRYTAIELGPDSYRPVHPFETFRLRYGDCKGKVSLLCTALREMNIEAYPALVNTSVREAVGRRLPSPFAFNHVIVKLVLAGKTIWVDPTRSHQGGLLWDRYLPRFGKALVIKPGVTALEDIPPPAADKALQRVTSTFRLNDYDSPVSLTVETALHGFKADDMRESFARNDSQEIVKDYLNFYSRYYPGVEKPRPLEIDDDRNQNVLKVTEHYQVRDFWETNESSQRLQATFYAESMNDMLTDPNTRLRKMPLRIFHPQRREQEIIVHLPDDEWEIPGLEEKVEHEAFSFHYQRKRSGATVRFLYECETRAPEVAVENVAGYLKKLEAMEDLLGDTLDRPDNSSKAILARMNWLMVVIACFGMATTLAASVWVWRATRTDMAALTALPPPLPGEARLQGLAGWLILVGIGLCIAPVWRVVVIVQSWEGFFSMDAWQAVTMPQGEHYHPFYGPLLIFEVLGNVLLLGLNVLVICLFFAKRRVFPKAYITFLASNVVFLLIDEIAGDRIPFVAANSDASSVRTVFRAALHTLIWSTYMLKSRRVKMTFVR